MPKDNEFFLDPEEVKKQKEANEKSQRENRLRINDMRKILSLPEGRRYIWSELERCKVFAPSFTTNSLLLGFNEGQRSIGIALLSDVELAKPGSYSQMFTEAMSKRNSAKEKEKEDGRPSES